jgi:hypothetical protein
MKGTEHLGDLAMDERIILTLTINKQDVRMRAGFIWLRIGPTGELM